MALGRLLPLGRRRQEYAQEEFINLELPFNPEAKSERTDNTVITSKYTWYNFIFVRNWNKVLG